MTRSDPSLLFKAHSTQGIRPRTRARMRSRPRNHSVGLDQLEHTDSSTRKLCLNQLQLLLVDNTSLPAACDRERLLAIENARFVRKQERSQKSAANVCESRSSAAG